MSLFLEYVRKDLSEIVMSLLYISGDLKMSLSYVIK